MAARIAALVLAAGRASRFGGPQTKVLALVDGQPMVRHSVQAALAAGLPVFVVIGYQGGDVRAALADLPVSFIENPDFADGMSTSLKAGILQIPAEFAAVLVLLADMPKVDAALCTSMLEVLAKHPAADAVVPVHAGERGNPALITRRLFGAIAALSGDQGARKILAQAANVMEIAVTDAAVRLDIDTPEALNTLSSGLPD